MKKRIKIDVFSTYFDVYLCTPDELEVEDVDDSLYGLSFDNKGIYSIWINSKHKEIERTLHHECFHLSCKILRDRDIRLIEETEEVYAFLGDWLFSETKKRLGI